LSKHTRISLLELADRLAIRELIQTYARCADRRDAKGWMALFTADAHFAVYMNGQDAKPSQELHSRDALGPIFAHFTQYDSTTHFVGQSTIFTLSNARATGEVYVLAHHMTVNGTVRQLNLASIRYNDAFVKVDDDWLFSERLLYFDWVDERALY
jgi:ketosteroid isomerase-like protein